MDFSLSDEQLALRDSIRKAPIDDWTETLAADEHAGRFSWEGWRRFAELGYLALPLPAELGGSGADLLTTLVAIEALGYRCRDSGLVHALVSQMLCGMQIAAYGTDEQKRSYLPRVASGAIVCAQALTEPDAGSDVAAIKARAEKCGDEYVLNGTKTFISNGPIADLVIVYASTGTARKALGGLSCFIVEKDAAGFSRSKAFEKMGLRTLQNGELAFQDCRVPARQLLGFEGQAMLAFNQVMEWERCLLFGAHLGTIQRVIEQCVRYAKQRSQFGSAIGRFQSVSHKIANMKVNLELGRLMLYKAAWMKDCGQRVLLETAIGKLFVSESLQRACLDAVQIHGAYGYAKEFDLERELRDSIASTIYSGTSEIQRNLIASFLGL
jgi:alkylation response protein AidB-like acyl-CoA dehydrogenase